MSGSELVTYRLLEKADTIAWAQWLKRQGCVTVFGLGESMGASVLIQAEAQEHVFTSIALYGAAQISRLPKAFARPAAY